MSGDGYVVATLVQTTPVVTPKRSGRLKAHLRNDPDVRGDEERVIVAFCSWLESEGWSVQREVTFVDVLAKRDGVRLLCEAKGRTTSPGLDVDTMYGQLLRRMTTDTTDRYAVVVPSTGLGASLRVPEHVRELLRIDVYGVDEAGAVERQCGS